MAHACGGPPPLVRSVGRRDLVLRQLQFDPAGLDLVDRGARHGDLAAAEAGLLDAERRRVRPPVVRDGLRGMLSGDPDLEVVGEASDGAEALAVVGTLRPDVILMDLRMPGMGGAAAIRALAEQRSPARVLVLTTYDSDSDVVPALEAGATGYLLKDAPRDELVRAIRAAARGEVVLASSVATRLVSQLRAPAQDALSDRELEVLALIAQGETNRGAAARLFISEATVKTHLIHIYEKLAVNDRAAAVAAGYERGLLTTRSG
jgi:DNA-binding NarL/FixJ family response regulator